MPITDAAFLHRLKRRMRDIQMSARTLGEITDLKPDRVQAILLRREEPWFLDAVAIARAVGTNAIGPLITGEPLIECDLGVPLPSDIQLLRANVPVPMTLACRVAVRFGFTDPIHLAAKPIDRQVWQLLLDRGGGACPYCLQPIVGDAGHLPTCLPHLLYGVAPSVDGLVMPQVRREGKGRRASYPGKGLKAAREAAGVLQQELSAATGIDTPYLSKLESLKLPLTLDKAEQIAKALRCDPAILYVEPQP